MMRLLRPTGVRVGGVVVVLAVFAAAVAGFATGLFGSTAYTQTNLVADQPKVAPLTDPHLVNAWGLTAGPTTPFWISDNGDGRTTVHTGSGQPFPAGRPLDVAIPAPGGVQSASPTGVVFNGTKDFAVSQLNATAPSLFLFATEDGTISGWSPTVNRASAILAVDRSAAATGGAGAVYKGLAIGHNASGNVLFATNFRAGRIEAFDGSFRPAVLDGSFADPQIPAGFVPFDIANIGGQLFVTYAKQDGQRHDDVAGRGNGFVDVFDTEGRLVRRFASGGTLDSPWGLAQAPKSFGRFSGDVLVGDFGDGRINAFDPASGAFKGQLQGKSGALTVPGLWGISFGNGHNAASPQVLYFAAGPDGEQHGLFGSIHA